MSPIGWQLTLEKNCQGKAPSKSLIPDLIKQFDKGYDVLYYSKQTILIGKTKVQSPVTQRARHIWEILDYLKINQKINFLKWD